MIVFESDASKTWKERIYRREEAEGNQHYGIYLGLLKASIA